MAASHGLEHLAAGRIHCLSLGAAIRRWGSHFEQRYYTACTLVDSDELGMAVLVRVGMVPADPNSRAAKMGEIWRSMVWI